MPAPPAISVILTTCNRRHLLPRAIASVLAQDDAEFELIIVDDCSTDDSRSYLAGLRDPRIRVLATPRNSGVAAARNVGLDAARADVFALLDDDDVYLPNRLSAPLRIFSRHPDVVCTLSSAVKISPKKVQTAVMPDLKLASKALAWALLCDLIGVEGTSITARRAAAASIGGFSTRMKTIEDREFLIRMARLGGGYLIAEPLWQKYWSDSSLSAQRALAGAALVSYAAMQPELARRFRKLGSYLATKILVADLRHGLFAAFLRDWSEFRAAGLIDGNVGSMWSDHREVAIYRRKMKSGDALAALNGPPEQWA